MRRVLFDLAVANLANNNLSELIGTGTGLFQLTANVALDAQPVGIAAADFNGDGKCDLAITENNAGIGLALNDGTGAFNNVVLYAAGAPAGLVAGHFNLGQGLDLALVGGGEGGYIGGVVLLLNKVH